MKESVQVNEKVVTSKFDTQNRLDRFARIFFRLFLACCIAGISLLITAFLLPVIHGLAYTLLFVFGLLAMGVIIIVTFGTVFTIENNIIEQIWNFLSSSDIKNTATIANVLYSIIPIVSFTGIAVGVLSIVMSVLSKPKKIVGKIVAIAILSIVIAILLVIYYLMGDALWQS